MQMWMLVAALALALGGLLNLLQAKWELGRICSAWRACLKSKHSCISADESHVTAVSSLLSFSWQRNAQKFSRHAPYPLYACCIRSSVSHSNEMCMRNVCRKEVFKVASSPHCWRGRTM